MLRNPRNAWIAVLVFALVAGFLVTGHYLYQTPIGLYDTAFFMGGFLQKVVLVFVPDLKNSAGGGVLLLLSLLAIGTLSFWVVRHAVRAKSVELDPGRRTFLTGAGSGIGAALGGVLVGSAAAAARGFYGVGQGNRGWRDITLINDSSVAFTHPEYLDSWKGARVIRYRRLGRTNFEVSDIVLGTGRIAKEEGGERIAREAIDRGVNYFDTSPDYSGAGSEEVMGRAIKGVRDKLFVATKFCMPTGILVSRLPRELLLQVTNPGHLLADAHIEAPKNYLWLAAVPLAATADTVYAVLRVLLYNPSAPVLYAPYPQPPPPPTHTPRWLKY